jgi:hypothetical protein
MNHSTRVMRRPRRAWPPAARTAAAVIATAALVLLAAACSSSPSHTGSGGSSTGSGASTNAGGSASSGAAITYSQCMRSHGVPNFPDPPSNGQVPKASTQLLGVSTSRLQAAQTACQHLYPNNGGSGGVLTKDSIGQCEETGDCPQALVQAAMTALRTYARCMRSHGVPNWPDPTIDSEGRPGFDLLHTQGFDPNSSQTSNIMHECYHVMPGGVPAPVTAPGSPG